MIKIEAAARLKTVTAADANDAGKIVLWIEKATGLKGKKGGKAGKGEEVAFKGKFGDAKFELVVMLTHLQDKTIVQMDGGLGFPNTKLDQSWSAEKKTGRATIIELKEALKKSVTKLEGKEGTEEAVQALKKLISAKSKVE